MRKLFDADGNEVEAYTKEEYEAVNTKLTEVTTKQGEQEKLISEQKEKIATQASQLSGQRHKYEKLSEMSEESKAKLTASERQVLEIAEKLENEKRASTEFRRNNVLEKLVGKDEKLKEAALKHYELLGTLPDTNDEEIARRLGYAVNNARLDLGIAEPSNPISAALSAAGIAPRLSPDEGKSFAETPDGKSLASKLGINI